jgi:1-acyl-sn-glycerol-3-phosphate acyltransferase
VANHSSHMDTPAILRALPRRWRRWTVVGAAADYFYRDRLRATCVSVLFNTVPIARRASADSLAHVDRLLEAGHSVLLYPEGTRSRTGRIGPLRRGAALLAARHGVHVMPIHVQGTRAAMPPGTPWPRRRSRSLWSPRHRVTVAIGAPIPVAANDGHAATARISQFFELRSAGRR